jgi:hypothetical protein
VGIDIPTELASGVSLVASLLSRDCALLAA